jgi:NDP-sugar pyrophosphorylase family protein
MGLYAFEPKVLDYIPKDQHMDFPDLVQRLIDNHEPVFAYEFDGYWLDLGNHNDYQQAIQDYENMHHIFLPQ